IFTRKKSLREHQTVHTGARPYSCQTCAKSFSTASNLRVHKRSHSEERPYKCDECDKAFKCRMGLLQHRVVHSGEKPFTCPTCGLSFGLKYNFQRHLRLHSGEKPFRYENDHKSLLFIVIIQIKMQLQCVKGNVYQSNTFCTLNSTTYAAKAKTYM
uniref:C2H2-type domain-containing protein n=1 Tax=Neolamprologus brichardi TaxID=32507 RepID=A0A3Q4H2S7_NEOBR